MNIIKKFEIAPSQPATTWKCCLQANASVLTQSDDT